MSLTTKFSALQITPRPDDKPEIISPTTAPTTAVGEGYLRQQDALRRRCAAMFKLYLEKRAKLGIGCFGGLSWRYEDEPEEEDEDEVDEEDKKNEAEESKWLEYVRKRAAVKAAHQIGFAA
ncbi:hypothetical protein JOM56_013517 [Amanita muscaria]